MKEKTIIIDNEDGTVHTIEHTAEKDGEQSSSRVKYIANHGEMDQRVFSDEVILHPLGPKVNGNFIKPGHTVEVSTAVAQVRLTELNNKFPCDENEKALECLAAAQTWLAKRRRDRRERNVLGTEKS